MPSSTPTLFHATRRVLSSGEVVTADAQSDYYPAVLSLLELHRPPDLPSRSICVFASDSAVASTRFLIGQGVRPEEIKLYRVQMDRYHKASFRVINELHNLIKVAGSVETLIDEYWQPKFQWVFWEYFGPSFTVMEELAPVSAIALYAFDINYGRDIDLSQTL